MDLTNFMGNPMRVIFKFSTVLLTIFLGACATGPRYGGNVSYVDPKSIEQTSNEFSMSDVSMVAEEMATKMLQSPALSRSKEVIRIEVSNVKNLTGEYVNTSLITNKIRNTLVNSGRVEFAGGADQNQAAVDALRRQNQSGLYDQRTTAKMGKMQGAKYRVEGALVSMTQRGAVKSVSYNFNMQLIDIERNVQVWGDEKEIRKVSGR
jgi:uncharacterized protein (TIGR02722 family)